MKAKKQFNTFNDAITSGTMPIETLSYYVELDPECPIPKLRFIPGTISDDIPEGYDVDKVVYDYLRKSSDAIYEKDLNLGPRSGRKHILAEGDSWFNMPIFIRPKTIADRLNDYKRYKVKNVAYWGHTIRGMLNQREYIENIDPEKTECLILSAGGNDLQNGLENTNDCIVKRYDPSIPVTDYLTTKGWNLIQYIDDSYREMINEVISAYPEIKIYCHGYDYPRPLKGKGKYIGKYLRRLDIPDHLMSPVMNPVIDILNQRISTVCDSFGNNVNYVNCLTATEGLKWIDDMHPGSDGFKALARVFAASIG